MEHCFLSLSGAVREIQAGHLTSEALTRSCLARIEQRDPDVMAWQFVDPAQAISAAREHDKAALQRGGGPLAGVPFGVKDMIDTVDMPTTHNSLIYQGHQPAKDAACVTVLKHAGAVVLGKTDTVEFAAFGRKAATRNPHNLAHTPGGSSSGSAAAVADWQVPFALGTQTGGSLIRPASFNGIYALKPTWASVSSEGAKLLSVSADTIGWYAREVADLRLLADVFRLRSTGAATLPADLPLARLRVGLCRSPHWDAIDPDGERAFEVAGERLRQAGVTVRDLTMPPLYDGMLTAPRTVVRGEAQAAFLSLWRTERERMSATMNAMFDKDAAISAEQFHAAQRLAERCRFEFDDLFEDIDVILTPACPGEAPATLTTSGDSVFNGMWTLLHVPCVAVPCTAGARGMPVGIQLVGPAHSDLALLAIAEILAPLIDQEKITPRV